MIRYLPFAFALLVSATATWLMLAPH